VWRDNTRGKQTAERRVTVGDDDGEVEGKRRRTKKWRMEEGV